MAETMGYLCECPGGEAICREEVSREAVRARQRIEASGKYEAFAVSLLCLNPVPEDAVVCWISPTSYVWRRETGATPDIVSSQVEKDTEPHSDYVCECGCEEPMAGRNELSWDKKLDQRRQLEAAFPDAVLLVVKNDHVGDFQLVLAGKKNSIVKA